MKKREVDFNEELLSEVVFSTDSATQRDSGTYNCTAYSAGIMFFSDNDRDPDFSDGTVVTRRSISVVVLGNAQ